jgi:hypothetical protein
VANDEWLGNLRRQLIQEYESAKYFERLAPSGEHRERNQCRQQRRTHRADVWNEPQQECD